MTAPILFLKPRSDLAFALQQFIEQYLKEQGQTAVHNSFFKELQETVAKQKKRLIELEQIIGTNTNLIKSECSHSDEISNLHHITEQRQNQINELTEQLRICRESKTVTLTKTIPATCSHSKIIAAADAMVNLMWSLLGKMPSSKEWKKAVTGIEKYDRIRKENT